MVDVLFAKINIIMKNNMNKEKIVVPSGVRYIGEWKEYDLENYAFPHILNKVLTGCGFTEYCISNLQDIVLCSPRKFLLENKEDQHPGELYYARNELLKGIDYELDISKIHYLKEQKNKVTVEEIKTSVMDMKQKIKDYCNKCAIKKVPKKILVTYDSFRHVKDALQELGIFGNFQVIIDEFQSIFIDSRFKSDTELELLGYLKDVKKLCYVSATPMLDKYLDMLDEFKDLPYFELDWITEDFNRIVHPKLEVRFTGKSLNEEAKKVIESYQNGRFEQRLNSQKAGEFIESREATLFLNSVKGICQAIKTNMLHINECNVLCARTEQNEKEVRKAFNDVLKKETEHLSTHPKIPGDYEVIGRIPKKGEPHKMFTFCTRTVYLGADFYSTNSRTFIFSDANIDCLSVDISMDLEQILGRQRLDENPWKNSARLYVKTLNKSKSLSEDDFKLYLDKKIKRSKKLLEGFNDIRDENKHEVAETYETAAKCTYYKKDYVAVNHHAGGDLVPVFNNLVLVSEIRSFEVQQIDYKDRFSVFASLKEGSYIRSTDSVEKELSEFEAIGNTREKLKYLVKYTTETPGVTEQQINNFLSQIPSKYSDYYYLLGPERIKANGYLEADLRKEWIKVNSEVKIDEGMITRIYNTFNVGEKYGKAKIKSTLKNIYSEFNFDKTAKASDLTDYFVLKSTKAQENGSWVNGFEILGKR